MSNKYRCLECGEVIDANITDPVLHVIEYHIDIGDYIEQIDND